MSRKIEQDREVCYTIRVEKNYTQAQKERGKQSMMTREVRDFKKYVESEASHNHGDFDVIEQSDAYDFSKYNEAVKKINEAKRECDEIDFPYYTHLYAELFTNEELLDINVMYACICTGAIESEMTQKLADNWAQFAHEIDVRFEMAHYY